ncbi:hypothetical protein AnigIFM63326_006400 [Aspergillus niger]|nr:hypothetical protein AnigIFM63326_006400 [Aspergillus niger]
MASSTAFASTNGIRYINRSIERLGSYQLTPGFLVPNAKIQQPPRTKEMKCFFIAGPRKQCKWTPYLSQALINATAYERRLGNLQKAIKDYLWSDKLQAYCHSEAYQDFFSQEANALAILSDTTQQTGNRTAALLSTMAQHLYIPKGALAFSNASIASGFAQAISPYTSGYHLKTAFHANDGVNAKRLLHSVWGPISGPNHANSTGYL